MNGRIELNDSVIDIITKMSDGNPGAMNVLISMMKTGGSIDHDSALSGLGGIITLDSIGVYGTDIYVLHNDICEGSMPKTISVLRACQLGLFSRDIVKDAASRQDRSGKAMIPVDELYASVKERLPLFDKQS